MTKVTGGYPSDIHQFSMPSICEKYLMDNKHIQQINRRGYLSLDITCCSKLAGFLELRYRKTINFSQQLMFADRNNFRAKSRLLYLVLRSVLDWN